MLGNFQKEFEKEVRKRFPLMYQNRKFCIDDFCSVFPRIAEKITNLILKKREFANSRHAINKKDT